MFPEFYFPGIKSSFFLQNSLTVQDKLGFKSFSGKWLDFCITHTSYPELPTSLFFHVVNIPIYLRMYVGRVEPLSFRLIETGVTDMINCVEFNKLSMR